MSETEWENWSAFTDAQWEKFFAAGAAAFKQQCDRFWQESVTKGLQAMTQPKYPVGTLLRHLASGEKVLVTESTFVDCSPEKPRLRLNDQVTEPFWIYRLESGPGGMQQLYGDEAVDLRYERVERQNAEIELWKTLIHNPLFGPAKPVAVQVPCRQCKQTYKWTPGEGDPFCPRCEPDYPLTATPRDS